MKLQKIKGLSLYDYIYKGKHQDYYIFGYDHIGTRCYYLDVRYHNFGKVKATYNRLSAKDVKQQIKIMESIK